MSYRSKRTRAAALNAATNAPDAVLNKAPKLVLPQSSQPPQKEPKASMPSASVQKSGEAYLRWGPFNLPNTQNVPTSSTTNISTQPPPPKSNPIWKKPLNVPNPPSNTNTQDLPSSSTTNTSKPLPQKSNIVWKKQHNVPNSKTITNSQDLPSSFTTNISAQPPTQKSNPTMKNPTNVTNPSSITNTHNFPSSSTQNTSTIPQKIPPSKLSKPPIFPSTSHTSHQPLLQEMQDDPTANKDKDKHTCEYVMEQQKRNLKFSSFDVVHRFPNGLVQLSMMTRRRF